MSNLPPGVDESMIPGNRPEDLAWDKFHEEIGGDCDQEGLTARDAGLVWELGIVAYRAYLNSLQKCAKRTQEEPR